MPQGHRVAAWLRGSDHAAAHTTTAYARGFTKRDLADAVAHHGVARVRRSWLTTLPAGAPLRRALGIGGRLTCVSEAQRLGLWVPDATAPHVWLPRSASRFAREDMHIHRSAGPAPAPPHRPTEPLINALFHVAGCLAPGEALTVWESALRRTPLTKEMRSSRSTGGTTSIRGSGGATSKATHGSP